MSTADNPLDFENFIPEAYKDRSANVIGKFIDILEKFVNGEISEEYNFSYEVENLYEYWDTLRKDFLTEVRDILDPLGVSNIIIDNEESLRRFLYLLANLFASKGTQTMLSYILRLVGMDAKLVQWYEDEYLNYRPKVEKCRSIMLIEIGNNALTDAMVEKLQRLMDLLLDVCLVISVWVYIKRLTDDVNLSDSQLLQLFIDTGHYDRYNIIAFELYNRYSSQGYTTGGKQINRVQERGNWSNYTTYKVGDRVTYNQTFYKCFVEHVSTDTFENSNWRLEQNIGLNDFEEFGHYVYFTNKLSNIEYYEQYAGSLDYLGLYPWEYYKLNAPTVRFLSIHDVIRYECNNCNYLYDPLGWDRIPFSELPFSWVCPSCGASRLQFTPIEFNPNGSLVALKWLIANMIRPDLFEGFLSLANESHRLVFTGNFHEFLDEGAKIYNDDYVEDVLQNTFSEDLLIAVYNFLDAIEQDNFKCLSQMELSISPAAMDKYARGYVTTPYIFHGNSLSSINYIFHDSTEDCPHYHNSRFTHGGPPGHEFTKYAGQEHFFVHVKDPLLRYGSETNFHANHDYVFRRGERYDYTYDPRKRCQIIPQKFTENGPYPYPRHSGRKEVHDSNAFFYGFVNNDWQSNLLKYANDIPNHPEFLALIAFLDQAVVDMYNSYTLLSFFKAFDKIHSWFDDQKYIDNLGVFAQSNLSVEEYSFFTSAVDYIQYINSL